MTLIQRMKQLTAKARSKRERGVVLVVAALGFTSFLGVAGLAIDVSHYYLAGTELQNAADASALAASSALNNSAAGIQEAVNRATSTVNKFEFSSQITPQASNIRFAKRLGDFALSTNGLSASEAAASPTNVRYVKVMLPGHRIDMLFTRVLTGQNTAELSRSAIAGLSVAAMQNDTCPGCGGTGGGSGNTSNPGDGGGGGTGMNIICDYVPLAVLQDPVTLAPLAVNADCPVKTEFWPGCTYTIRADSNTGNNNTVSAGNYQILAFNDDRGGSDARIAIASGFHGCYKMGDWISKVNTEPGMKAGVVRAGMNTRFGDYGGGLSYVDFPPDKNVKENISYAEYLTGLQQYSQSPSGSDAAYARPGRRIVILPIINKNEFDNGRDVVRVYRFAPFFIRSSVPGGNGGEITAEYINQPIVANARFVPNLTDYMHGANRFLATTVRYE